MEIVLMTVALLGIGRWLLPYIIHFLWMHDLTGKNYRGEFIPTAGGLFIWVLVLIQSAIGTMIASNRGEDLTGGWNASAAYFGALNAIALLGFIDDSVGAKTKAKGIGGHWKLWAEHRRISTGLMKAGGILLAAFPVVWVLKQVQPVPWHAIPAQILLIGLMANGMNLLDLRPGRALKGFWALLLLLCGLIFSSAEAGTSLAVAHRLLPDMLPIVCGALILLGPDLQGKLMIGDTGANIMGFALGCWIIASLNLNLQYVLLAMFIALHVLTWRWSLTTLIERNRLLLWFDRLGRGGAGKIGGA